LPGFIRPALFNFDDLPAKAGTPYMMCQLLLITAFNRAPKKSLSAGNSAFSVRELIHQCSFCAVFAVNNSCPENKKIPLLLTGLSYSQFVRLCFLVNNPVHNNSL
jgi:hypothetical protein